MTLTNLITKRFLAFLAVGIGACWSTGYTADEFERAVKERKQVLIEFVAESDRTRAILARNIQASPDQRRERFVERVLLPPHDPLLVSRYRVARFPTLIVLRADGTEIDRLVGDHTENEVSSFLLRSADGSNPIAQLKQKALGSFKVEDHGRFGDALMKTGSYAEALNEFAWVLDEGRRADPAGFLRVLKTTVSRVRELRAFLPEANAVLAKLAQQEMSEQSQDSYTTAFAVNQVLGESHRNAAHFCEIPADSPLRCELFHLVFADLVTAKRYREAALTIDTETYVGRLFPLYYVTDKFHPGADVKHTHRVAAEARSRVMETSLAAIEATVGVGQLEKARRIAGRLIDWSFPKDVKADISAAAKRADPESSTAFHLWLGEYAASSQPIR